MKCLDSGTLRAYLDKELESVELRRAEEHLGLCLACRSTLERTRDAASFIGARLAPVALGEDTTSPEAALGSFKKRLASHPEQAWWQRRLDFMRPVFQTMRRRSVAAGVTLVVVLAVVLAVQPVRSAAEDFLRVFRVQRFQAVTIDTAALSAQTAAMPALDPSAFGTFSATEPTRERVRSVAEASEKAGFGVLTPSQLPEGYGGEPEIWVTGVGSMSLTLDLAKARAALASLGVSEVELPQELDGATISLEIPPFALLTYQGERAPLVLAQGRSPTLKVPAGVDVEKVREELLRLPGLPTDLVEQLRAIGDWTGTVVVPIPEGAVSEQVSVGEAEGLLLIGPEGTEGAVLWQKGGILYALGGEVSRDQLMATANSLH